MKTFDITLREFILTSLSENIPKDEVVESLDYSFLNSLKFSVKAEITRELTQKLTQGVTKILRDGVGHRFELLSEFFKQTPFRFQFEYVSEFGNDKCQKPGEKHLFYHQGSNGDPYEPGTYFRCLYCGIRETKSRRASLSGEQAKLGFMPHEKLHEANQLLSKLHESNLSNEEIKRFVELIVALGM